VVAFYFDLDAEPDVAREIEGLCDVAERWGSTGSYDDTENAEAVQRLEGGLVLGVVKRERRIASFLEVLGEFPIRAHGDDRDLRRAKAWLDDSTKYLREQFRQQTGHSSPGVRRLAIRQMSGVTAES